MLSCENNTCTPLCKLKQISVKSHLNKYVCPISYPAILIVLVVVGPVPF